MDPASTKKPLGGLAWIAAYKLLKASLSVAGALLALRLAHRNIIKVGHRWLEHLGVDPEGRLGVAVLARLAHLDAHRLNWTTAILLFYALLYCVEGIGLFMEARWAEWLTVAQTSLLIPFEIYQLVRRPTLFKAGFLAMSVVVVGYLLWRLRRDRLEHA